MAIRIALAGNPNCGKTTMFNALTGANQYVGNWPGVTVEKKEGKLKSKKVKEEVVVTDLPGIYSLSPYTLEEVVSRDYLLKENPDVIVDLVDATNIERNLYLTTQLIETGVPVVIALNMADLLEKRGIKIDVARLSMLLDCPIVETSALKGEGLDKLIDEAIKTAKKKEADLPKEIFNKDLEDAVSAAAEVLPSSIDANKKRWYAVKFLEKDSKVAESVKLTDSAAKKIEELRAGLEKSHDDDMESIVTDERYKFIQKIVGTTVKKGKDKLTTSDKIDKIVTNRILGIPIFIAVMFVVYYISVTTIGTIVTDWTNDTFVGGIQEIVGGFLEGIGTNDVVTSLVVDGVIGGVGAVLGFVPQMAILFLFLSILEDCGYMVRIAFVMDRVFRHFGLSGKSFIPLLISSGCGIPGIMASKTIEQDNDRRLTIMTATFIPCGAKLPVIALMGGVMASWATGSYEAGGFMAPAMYFMGIVAVLVAAIILKKTKPFSGKPAPFVMELPQYHVPQAKTVLLHVWERLKGFIIKAGTILFLACVVMWFLGGFGFENGGFGLVEESGNSLLAVIGGFIAPLFVPLGFGEWQPVAASLSGFTAKEAIVSTMGVLANVTGDTEDAVTVAQAVQTWFPTSLAALSFLIFNLLDSPCLAAIATMAQQMQSKKWFWFAILFQNIFAYIVCLCIYQIGSFVTGGSFGVGTVFGFVFTAIILFLLFRPDPYKDQKVYSKRSVQAAN
ncbi:MAG: ferrous iron transport protein B [Lachnospiraceae bacterium]|nr:ferrous iron transport protein B [Lachnospiraceae bacterium]MBD9124877.1 ferrous iron transport protein B [Lachnospiraceae bacterium]MBD9125166.1 ferrous iron transport protein B [Lachnospiraceae bacterium]